MLARDKSDRPFTVDVHAHVMNVAIEKMIADHPLRIKERAETATSLGAESAKYNAQFLAPQVLEPLTNVQRRLDDMVEMGVDMQVLSPAPGQYFYWADRSLAEALVEEQNGALADICQRNPSRFMALGNVALQHPDLAVTQLYRAVRDHRLVGVEVSSTVEGMELADSALDAFWAAANELQCVVFIHPLGTSAWPRLATGYLTNSIGQPLETAIALSRLIHAGTLDRYPKVRILAAHGGGFLPSYLGRTDHAWCVRPEARTSKYRPSEYLRQMWFDTVVYDPMVLQHLMQVIGIGQLVVGSDYPYDMGMYKLHDYLGQVPDIRAEDIEQICYLNVQKLLNLDLSHRDTSSKNA